MTPSDSPATPSDELDEQCPYRATLNDILLCCVLQRGHGGGCRDVYGDAHVEWWIDPTERERDFLAALRDEQTERIGVLTERALTAERERDELRYVLRETLAWLRQRPVIVDGWPREHRKPITEIEQMLDAALSRTREGVKP